MRRSPWLPVLLLVGLGLYLAPRQAAAPLDFHFDFNPLPQARPSGNLPPDAADLFKKARPATVRVEQSQNAYGQPDAIGTGFFIDKTGTLLTAYHVIDGARYLNVTTAQNRRYRADVVGFDAARDVAVLKARLSGEVPFLPLVGRPPRVGEKVLAIGNSGGEFLQPRRGRLLRLNADAARVDFPQGTLEMSAPLAPGDSGGPILDGGGNAIGVVSYIRLAGDGLGSLNDASGGRTLASYAVPVSSVDQTVAAIRKGEKRDVPALGIQSDTADHTIANASSGAVVFEVAPNSPASRAGLRGAEQIQNPDGTPGLRADVIVAVDGKSTADFDELKFQIRQKRVGQRVTLTVQRGGQRLQLPVTLGGEASIQYRQ